MWLREDVAEQLLQRIEESDKAISGAVARDKVMWSQTAIFMDMGMANKKVMQQGMELYRTTMAALRHDMVNLVSSFQGGLIDMNTAIKDFKFFMNRHYQTLFKAGAMASGNPYYADPSIGLTKKDLAFISAARRQELGFFKKFLLDMSNPYHHPRHPYLQRAGYYADSGKAQFFNGMVNGFGDSMEIKWVLGMAEEHCSDCPMLAAKTYTWQTLPTTPRAGDTECLFNCKCHLEFQRRQAAPAKGGGYSSPVVPGSATQAATEVPGRWASVTNLKYQDMMGQITKDFDDMFAAMYKARQMVNITTGAERKEWIQIRRQINDRIINRMKLAEVRVTPTVSVKELIDTIQAAKVKGAGGVLTRSAMTDGTEVVLVRGNAAVIGIVQRVGGELMINTAAGQQWRYNNDTDIALLIGGPTAAPAGTAAPTAPWASKMSAAQADTWAAGSTVRVPLYHATGPTAAQSIVQNGFNEGSHGMYGAGVYFSTSVESQFGNAALEARINVRRMFDWDDSVWLKARTWWEARNPGQMYHMANGVTEYLKAQGYEGIAIPNKGGNTWYVVFDPKKVTVVKLNGQPTVGVAAPPAPVRNYQPFTQYDPWKTREWDRAIADAATITAPTTTTAMSERAVKAVGNYQGWSYGTVNRYLRRNEGGNVDLAQTQAQIAGLDEAMKMATIRKDIILHRVTNVEGFGALRAGATFVDKGFVSASTQMKGAENLMRAGKWHVEICVPKGTPAVSLPNMLKTAGPNSWLEPGMTREELEIILPRNCRFKIIYVNETNKTMRVEVLDVNGVAV